MARLFVIILAAGLSQRLGIPKQLVRQHGISLLSKTIQQAQALSPKAVFVVTPAPVTAWARQIHAELATLPVVTVHNPHPQNGMAHSLRRALHALADTDSHRDDRVLILTIDQVALTVADLHALYQPADSHELVLSRYGEPPVLGVPVNLPWGFLCDYAARLQGDKGLRALWQDTAALACAACGVDYRVVAVDVPQLAMDLDTMAQFEAFKERFDLALPIL